jgi:hypothetical protein
MKSSLAYNVFQSVFLAFLAAVWAFPCSAEGLEGQGDSGTLMGYLSLEHLQPAEISERVICSVIAAVKYDVPANIILGVAEIEGGKPGQYVPNDNGTFDVGTMQFNTAFLSTLEKYGISAKDVEKAGCYSYDLAAWRLSGHIRSDSGDIWKRASNYHSRTPRFNSIYREKLIKAASKWERWLDARFATRDVSTVH